MNKMNKKVGYRFKRQRITIDVTIAIDGAEFGGLV